MTAGCRVSLLVGTSNEGQEDQLTLMQGTTTSPKGRRRGAGDNAGGSC